MSIEANMQGVIENRNSNFYSQFDVYAYTTATYAADPTSEFYGLTALEILEEEELFGGVPRAVLDWANSQKLPHFVSQEDPDFNFIPKFKPDTKGPADPKPTQTAEDILKEKLYTARKNRFKGLQVAIEANINIYYTNDESSDFFGYTYDEILGMHANGVSIPDEVLDWANSMADENSTEANENTEGSDAQTLYTSLKNSPFMNIKTITKIFVKRSNEETKELEEILEALEPIEREMAQANVDAETKREDAVKNVEALTKEWLALEAKVKNGEQLEASEQERFEELQGLFSEEDKNYQEGIDETTKNYNKFGLFLDVAMTQSDVAMDFGEKTIEVAAELADFERTHKSRGILGGLIGMGLGGVLSAWGLAGSKNFSQVAHTIGEGTVHFASDVQTMIAEVNALMSDTADKAGFDEEDPNHEVDPLVEDEGAQRAPVAKSKVNSNDGLNTEETKDGDEAASDVVTPETSTTETEGTEETSPTEPKANSENEEVSDEQLQENGERNLEEVNAKELSHPELKRLIKEEGEDSEKKGKEALKLVDELKAQSERVDEKEEEAEEANAQVVETSTEAVEAGAENTEKATDNGMTENGAEDVAGAEATAEQTVGELEGEAEKEELTVSGLRETYKGFKKANKKYSGDVKHADKRMKEDIYTGGFTIAGGGYMTGVGVVNIATGTSLISTAFLCPATLALAYYLIDIGVVELALGASMIAGGTALTVSANEGLEINDITREKIETSGDDIETATTSLDEFEATQIEAAEGKEGAEKSEEDKETQEETEEIEDPYLSVEEQMLVDMKKGNEILPPMRERANKEGDISETLGAQNLADLTGLARQIPSLIESTIAFETEKQAKEAGEAAGETDEVQEVSAQDPAEIYAQYRTDFNADLKQNAEFKKDIKATQKTATDNLELGAMGTLAGTARTALGSSEIALGTILAANIWNPIQMMIGLALIKKGTEDLALGTALLATGMALTVNSTATLAVGVMSDLKVNDSNEKTNFALEKVDEIEKQINDAVKEQMNQEGGGQNLKGMSVIQLLTVIIANGIKSEGLNAENTELFEALKEQVPEIMENITGEETIEENPEETAKNAESNAEEAKDAPAGVAGQGAEATQSEKSPFTKYITDFQKDLKTNIVYANEVKQAANQKLSIKSGFFLGAPVEKANAKIQQSIQQTQAALDETLKMEADYNKAVEEAKAQKEEEAKDPESVAEKVVASSKSKEATSEEEKDMSPKDAENAVKDSESQNAKEQKEADKSEKKGNKAEKTGNKTTKKAKKEDKKAKESEKQGKKSGEEGEKAAESAQPETKQGEADNALNQQSEAESLSAQVLASANEMAELADTTKAEADTTTAENEAINAEMNMINAALQQDQMKMSQINTEIEQESKKGDNNKPGAAPAPAQQAAAAPEPQQQPQKAPTKKAKKAKKAEPKAEDVKPENKPAQAPAQQPQAVETEQEQPEGADKTQYASDANKAPDFIGFVAQSDSLASGAVLAGKTKKAPAATNNQTQTNNQQQNSNKQQQVQAQRKANAKAKTEAKKEEKEENKTQQQAQNKQQPEIKAAARTTQKPFDVASMPGGAGGGGKTEQLKQSAQQIQAQAFNRQAKLSAMAIRANNNVQATIQKEAQAEAEAARKQREAAEKQEKIAKIKEYAGYVQIAGGLVSTTGMIVSWCGKTQMTAGTAQITAGTTQITMGTSTMTMAATTMTSGTAMTATGATMVGTGAAELATGATAITTGTVQITAGTVMVSTGTAMLSNPFTAAAGAALVSAGTALITSGTALETAGGTLTGLGSAQVPAGTATISAGTGMIGAGSSLMAGGTAQIAAGAATTAAGLGQLASGLSLEATGDIMQTIGTYITAAGAMVSAGADIANGDILGGITTIVAAAASCVGISVNVGTVAQSCMQLAPAAASIGERIVQMNQDAQNQQGNGQQKKQPDKKKMQKIQNNKTANNIINKTAKKAQAVGNRFNK